VYVLPRNEAVKLTPKIIVFAAGYVRAPLEGKMLGLMFVQDCPSQFMAYESGKLTAVPFIAGGANVQCSI
jgi:hypothetical protein